MDYLEFYGIDESETRFEVYGVEGRLEKRNDSSLAEQELEVRFDKLYEVLYVVVISIYILVPLFGIVGSSYLYAMAAGSLVTWYIGFGVVVSLIILGCLIMAKEKLTAAFDRVGRKPVWVLACISVMACVIAGLLWT